MQALQENSSILNLNEKPLTNGELLSIGSAMPSSANDLLQILYNNPSLQHKALAADSGLSITNLSNCINKISSIQPLLISTVKSGRSKFYSLTESGRRYVEQIILPNHSAKIRTFAPSSLENSKFNEAMQSLQQFQRDTGMDWDMELLTQLNSVDYTKTNAHLTDFINQLTWFKIHHKDDALKKIYVALEQNVLKKTLERYLEQFLKNYYILDPLFQLEKDSMEDAYFVIDEIFNALKHPADDSDSSARILLTDIQYNAIFHQFHIMINDFSQYNCDKKAVLNYWKSVYHTINPILLYIAEKCRGRTLYKS